MMPPALKEFVTHGFVSTVTGGLHYDSHAGTAINIVHLYAFLWLMIFPYLLYLSFPDSDSQAYFAWSAVYTAVTVLLFALIKLGNYLLHRAFDRLSTDETPLDDISTSLPTDATLQSRRPPLQAVASGISISSDYSVSSLTAPNRGIRRRPAAHVRRRPRSRPSIISVSLPDDPVEITVVDESAIDGSVAGTHEAVSRVQSGVPSDDARPDDSAPSAPGDAARTFPRPRSRTGQNRPRDGLRELEALSAHSMNDDGGDPREPQHGDAVMAMELSHEHVDLGLGALSGHKLTAVRALSDAGDKGKRPLESPHSDSESDITALGAGPSRRVRSTSATEVASAAPRGELSRASDSAGALDDRGESGGEPAVVHVDLVDTVDKPRGSTAVSDAREGSIASGDGRSTSEGIAHDTHRSAPPPPHRDPSVFSFGAASAHGTLVDALSMADSDATSRMHYDEMSIGTLGLDTRSNADAKSLSMRGHRGRHDSEADAESANVDYEAEDSHSVTNESMAPRAAPPQFTSLVPTRTSPSPSRRQGGDGEGDFHDVNLDAVEVVVAELEGSPAWMLPYLHGGSRLSRRSSAAAHAEREAGRPDDSGFEGAISPADAVAMLSGVSIPLADPDAGLPRMRPMSSSSVRKPRARIIRPFAPLSNWAMEVDFDRMALQQMLDKDDALVWSVASVLLAGTVAGVACAVTSFYTGFAAAWLWFVVAGCHYSLLKSPQPDSMSPAVATSSHGTSTARSVFFIAFAFCALLLVDVGCAGGCNNHDAYGVPLLGPGVVEFMARVVEVLILVLPAMFLLGLLPQAKTFAFYVFEQTDIHLLGGTGSSSLSAAVYSVAKCMAVAAACAPICAHALRYGGSNGPGTTTAFSVYVGLLVGLCHLLSKRPSSIATAWDSSGGFLGKACAAAASQHSPGAESDRVPFPRVSVSLRLVSDVLSALVIGIAYFLLHLTGCFDALQSTLRTTFSCVAAVVGFVAHYLFPQFRKRYPFLLFAKPILKMAEFNRYEASGPAKTMWFERAFVWTVWVEKHVLYPVIFVSALSVDAEKVAFKFHWSYGAAFATTMAGIKLLRGAFMDCSEAFVVLVASLLAFEYDAEGWTETFLFNYFVLSIVISKLHELSLKLRFVFVYLAPWNQGWGSAAHVFLQPLGIPHMTLLVTLATFSTIFSAPFFPLVGSAVFLISYVRPVKFWEKSYSTSVPSDVVAADGSASTANADVSNESGARNSSRNALFYQHLALSLQKSLCSDVTLGRLGAVSAGDFFLLLNDHLTAIVHIVSIGNEYVTFQLRGLEFKGTYCQQRELEAIGRDISNDGEGCLCFRCISRIPSMLGFNAALGARWNAWEVVTQEMVIDSYSIGLNPASTIFNTFDFRLSALRNLISAIAYHAVNAPHLMEWIGDGCAVAATLDALPASHHESSTHFSVQCDIDFDPSRRGVSLVAFIQAYGAWVHDCVERRNAAKALPAISVELHPRVVRLCYLLSLLARRVIASHSDAENPFVAGFSLLFRGGGGGSALGYEDAWALADADRLMSVVWTSARVALKLHQDSFSCGDEFNDFDAYHSSMLTAEEGIVICHEGDPRWRRSVLEGFPHLLSVRFDSDDLGRSGDHSILMLNRRHLNYRMLKVNREAVRGLWAGQQHELVFLRNRNNERGSIQQMKAVLRNLINSSCDLPIGYPIYVSPLITSCVPLSPLWASTRRALGAAAGAWAMVREKAKGVISAPREARDAR